MTVTKNLSSSHQIEMWGMYQYLHNYRQLSIVHVALQTLLIMLKTWYRKNKKKADYRF